MYAIKSRRREFTLYEKYMNHKLLYRNLFCEVVLQVTLQSQLLLIHLFFPD